MRRRRWRWRRRRALAKSGSTSHILIGNEKRARRTRGRPLRGIKLMAILINGGAHARPLVVSPSGERAGQPARKRSSRRCFDKPTRPGKGSALFKPVAVAVANSRSRSPSALCRMGRRPRHSAARVPKRQTLRNHFAPHAVTSRRFASQAASQRAGRTDGWLVLNKHEPIKPTTNASRRH